MSGLNPTNEQCRHGLPDNPDTVLTAAEFMSLPQDIRLAAEVCSLCSKLVLRARDDARSRSLSQRAWAALHSRPLTREPLTREQRESLAALTAAARQGPW